MLLQELFIDDEAIDLARLRAMSVDELKEHLQLCLNASTSGVIGAARTVLVLEELGADLSDIDGAWFRGIRMIARGQLIAGALFRCDGPAMLSMVASLPRSDQQTIADGKPFQVAVGLTDNGDIDHKMLTVEMMTPRQKQMVFGKGFIRSLAQQWNILSEKPQQELLINVKLGITQAVYDKLSKVAKRRKISIAALIRNIIESTDL